MIGGGRIEDYRARHDSDLAPRQCSGDRCIRRWFACPACPLGVRDPTDFDPRRARSGAACRCGRRGGRLDRRPASRPRTVGLGSGPTHGRCRAGIRTACGTAAAANGHRLRHQPRVVERRESRDPNGSACARGRRPIATAARTHRCDRPGPTRARPAAGRQGPASGQREGVDPDRAMSFLRRIRSRSAPSRTRPGVALHSLSPRLDLATRYCLADHGGPAPPQCRSAVITLAPHSH